MKAKLENLIEFGDFKSGWRAEQAKKTKRTETGLDILKEDLDNDLDSDLVGDGLPDNDFNNRGIEELVPEGLPEDDLEFDGQGEQDIDHILDELSQLDEEEIDEIVNYLREILLEMEQNGEIEENFTDDLDDSTAGDWVDWIERVITIPELAEEAIKGVSDMMFGGSREDRWEDDDDTLVDDGDTLVDDEGLDTATSVDELDKIPTSIEIGDED